MARGSHRSNSTCPVTFALDTFGDKWSLLILRDMFFKGKHYYGEFLASAEKISTNILADRLGKLEGDGLLTKSRDLENSSKYRYALTQKGKDLLPLMLEMVTWSARYDPQARKNGAVIDGAPEDLIQRAAEDRPALIAELLNSAPTSLSD